MNKVLFATILLFLCLTGFSQTDTIFTLNEKISCKSIKIKTDSINYKLIESNVLHTIAKKEVDKIVYKNGKTFSIKEDISIKHVDGISNFNDVVVTFTPSDTNKQTYICDVQIHFEQDQSGQSKYLEKAYKLLKIHAALRGANIVFVPEQKALRVSSTDDTTRMRIGISPEEKAIRISSIDTATISLYGIAYCSDIPTFDEFDKKIGEKTEFKATEQWYLPKGRTDVYQLYFNGKFIIDEISEVDGFVYITGELKGFPKVSTFRLIAISSKFFTVNFELNNVLYNVRVDL